MGKASNIFSRKYTFIFIPDVTGKFIRFSIPKLLVKSCAVFGVVFLVGFAIFSYDVIEKSRSIEELASLQSVTAEQKLEIQQFAKKIKQVETQLNRLEKFDRKLRVITALEPRTEENTDFGTGGPTHESGLDFSNSSKKYTKSLIGNLESDVDRISRQAQLQESSFFELDEFFREQSSLLSHTPSVWPVKGWVTSTFGYRASPFTGLREMHEGLDIATQLKSPVIVPADGIVTRVGFHRGYGNLVEIDHGYGVVTRFGHNSKNLVKVGQRVKRGDVISLVGSTGRSTGPHLHYEVLLNGVPVNPYRYIFED